MRYKYKWSNSVFQMKSEQSVTIFYLDWDINKPPGFLLSLSPTAPRLAGYTHRFRCAAEKNYILCKKKVNPCNIKYFWVAYRWPFPCLGALTKFAFRQCNMRTNSNRCTVDNGLILVSVFSRKHCIAIRGIRGREKKDATSPMSLLSYNPINFDDNSY